MIIKKLKKNTIIINYKDKAFYGIGFLQSKNPPGLYMPLLIFSTSNNLKEINSLLKDKKITFYMNNEEYRLNLDDSRKIYKNDNYNILIIEIIKKDECYRKNLFFEIDDKFSDKSDSTYLLFYQNNKVNISEGAIKRIDNFFFKYVCFNQNNLLQEGIIMNKSNFKALGILNNFDEKINNKGIFIKPLIYEFLQNYEKPNNLAESVQYDENISEDNISNNKNDLKDFNSLANNNNLKKFDEQKKDISVPSDNNKNKKGNNFNINNQNETIYSKKNIFDNKNNENEINLIFKLNIKKELYLEIKKNIKFNEVICKLNNKYLWLKNIKNIYFNFGGKIIDNNKTLQELGLTNNSIIEIIEKKNK